jgi:ABC-2 type transport system permease protein
MSGFWYGVVLQWKLDIRSKALLITCYAVPLIFFALMGGIFTSVNPEMNYTLIQSMTVMGVSMGALIGLPPSLVEMYGSDIKKAYKANGVPLYLGLASMFISAFIHLMIMSTIIYIVAPIAFDAALPSNLPLYYVSLAIFTAVSLSVGSVLGLAVKNQAKLTMFSQLVFLPSIMLSGIMFPIELLPKALETVGKIFPASWGYKLMVDYGFKAHNLWCLSFIFIAASILCGLLLKRQQSE